MNINKLSKIGIYSALVIFSLMTIQVHPIQGADKSQKLLLERTFSTSSGEKLLVNGCGGNVKVNIWLNNEIEVRIYGSIEARNCLDFEVSSDESGINICASKKVGIEKAMNLNLRYEISVPRDYIVRVLKGSRNTDMENENSPVEISTTGRNIGSGL